MKTLAMITTVLALTGGAVAAQDGPNFFKNTYPEHAFGEAEVREAVAIAANVRMWSTVLNGMAYDLDTFKAEHDEIAPPMN